MQITISEQGMAGSNSSGGAEGFSTLFLSMYFRRSRISCTQNHRKEKEIPLDPYTVLILDSNTKFTGEEKTGDEASVGAGDEKERW